MPLLVVSAVMDPNVKLSFTQNYMKNIERRIFAFQRAETVAHVHQYFDACMPVNVANENDTPIANKTGTSKVGAMSKAQKSAKFSNL